jgi:hypothetical protein
MKQVESRQSPQCHEDQAHFIILRVDKPSSNSSGNVQIIGTSSEKSANKQVTSVCNVRGRPRVQYVPQDLKLFLTGPSCLLADDLHRDLPAVIGESLISRVNPSVKSITPSGSETSSINLHVRARGGRAQRGHSRAACRARSGSFFFFSFLAMR